MNEHGHKPYANGSLLKTIGIMAAIVVSTVGPLWASHLHMIQEFAHIRELATNPLARPDSYTASNYRKDEAKMREWVDQQITLSMLELRTGMPPQPWRVRIRFLEEELAKVKTEIEQIETEQ